jgi:hypothetical protein
MGEPKPPEAVLLRWHGVTYIFRCGHHAEGARAIPGGLECETCGVRLERKEKA